jgi:multiple sugar transport system substrate-binding protein
MVALIKKNNPHTADILSANKVANREVELNDMRLLKKIVPVLLSAAMLTNLMACSSSTAENSASGGSTEKVSITFWSAPNATQTKYWTDEAKAFMLKNENITINVSAMSESPSSEAGITNAISSGTAPTASENITRGFAAQLAESDAIIDLSKTSAFSTIVKARSMETIVEGWAFDGGKQYVVPLYCSPTMIAYNAEIVTDNVPVTYDDLFALQSKLDKDQFLYYRLELSSSNWWECWYDFLLNYYAITKTPFITGTELTANEKACVTVLNYYQKLRDTSGAILKQDAGDAFPTGKALSYTLGSWAIPTMADKYPEFKYGSGYVLGMPLKSSSSDDGYTFGDAKGIVIYASASSDQQKAAEDFMSWVMSDSQSDMDLLEECALIPARGDFDTNATFTAYFKENPALKKYADAVKFSIPSMDNKNMTQIQTAMREKAILPLMNNKIKTGTEAWTAMKSAIQGTLD